MHWMRKSIGWIAGLAIGGFLLWIVGTAVSIQNMRVESAGTLFGRRVPVTDYVNALQAIGHQAVLTQGEKAARALPKEQLERQAWERLMLLAEAKRRQIHVSNKEVVTEISQWPIFHRQDGQFDTPAYQMILQYTLGVTPRAFEEEVRQTLTIGKLINQVAGKVQLAKEDLREPVGDAPKKMDAAPKKKPVTEEELLTRKRIKVYLAWYQDLILRANLQKAAHENPAHPRVVKSQTRSTP